MPHRFLPPLLLFVGLMACGDGGAPECKQVIRSCVDDCSISCGDGEEEACVGPDFGPYDIGDNDRCCICIDPDKDYSE